MEHELFLGLDSSTQGLKCTIVDKQLQLVYERALHFDRDLPQFETRGGVHTAADGLTVTSPALMWVAALDMLLGKMKADGAPLGAVRAISGSGQQHGSVWLGQGAGERLARLDAAQPLADQLGGIFTVGQSPVWMDSSTGLQCAAREAALGGAQATAEITGSRAYERFTGNQIAKIYELQADAYAATERICLVSSFMASLLKGGYVPIDASDGSGMNLMDIRTKDWSRAALACTAPGLAAKLGPIVASHADVGVLHPYYVSRYGFSPLTRLIAWSGDNPNSLAGLRLQKPGDIAISMGTSYTVFGFLREARPSATEGHIFVNPVDPNAYMAMVCYKNGALVRDRIRNAVADGSWKTFSKLVTSSPVGNNGQLGYYYFDPEITPPLLKIGVRRFNASGEGVASFDPASECRAVAEGQCLSMRLHGSNIGFSPKRILATGGASVDDELLRILSNVFGVPVYVAEKSDSASLGAAYRALHGLRCVQQDRFVPFGEALGGDPPLVCAMQPEEEAHAIYSKMLARYKKLETKVLAEEES
jgi:xylulokinase